MKIYVFNALEIELFDVFKKQLPSLECLKRVPGHSLTIPIFEKTTHKKLEKMTRESA